MSGDIGAKTHEWLGTEVELPSQVEEKARANPVRGPRGVLGRGRCCSWDGRQVESGKVG